MPAVFSYNWRMIFSPTITGSRGVLFHRISSQIHCTITVIVARIDLLLIQIAVRDPTVNMRLCYMSVEILSVQMVGARRATIPESEAFRTKHEVPRVKKETRDESYHHVTRWMWTVAYR